MALQIKGSHIPGVVPAGSELEERELAVNTKDKKLYSKTPDGNIIEIGADNINTGLETPTPDGGIHSGHRYINTTDSADYLPLGADATDLSYSSGSNPGVASIGASGVGSFTAGIDAIATGIHAFALGKDSNVSGDDSFSIGNNNITKNLSFSLGNNSTISGPLGTVGSFSIGTQNNVAGDGSVAIGYSNIISYDESVMIGSNNESFLNRSYGLGYALQSSNIEGGVVLGKFNEASSNKSLIVGSGTSSSNRKNILELDANTGVLSLPLLNSTGNIQSNFDVVTLGYLEAYTNVVRTVNGYSGNVSLTVADINEQSGVDRFWLTQAEKDQLVANTNAIPTKEPLLPTANATNEVLTVLDPVSRTYEWKTIGASSISMNTYDLLDVGLYGATDSNKFLRINGAGTATVWESISRTDLNLINDGGSTIDPVSGLNFELSSDPYNWGISNATTNYVNSTRDAITDPIGDYTLIDSDINNGTGLSVLVDAINNVNGKSNSNITNIGDLTTLTTVDKTSAVNAINENNSNIQSLQSYILGSGTTASRPTTTLIGAQYFDTDISKPIWFDGTNWVDATGTTV